MTLPAARDPLEFTRYVVACEFSDPRAAAVVIEHIERYLASTPGGRSSVIDTFTIRCGQLLEIAGCKHSDNYSRLVNVATALRKELRIT